MACGAGGDPDRGLTDLGREAVRRMQRLNILPDVSHLNDRSFWAYMDLARAGDRFPPNCRRSLRCSPEPDG